MAQLRVAVTFAFAISLAGHCFAAPRVVEGDGVSGPKGMVWVPGGEFQMGSDTSSLKATSARRTA